MAFITVKNVSFAYEQATVLENISFSIEEGQFVTICGVTGSGKSTLLRLLKKELQPVGELLGEIYVDGTPIQEVDSSKISFVMQHPDEQLVMEKVWQELSYPLENMALPQQDMLQQIAEVMHFLGIHQLFNAHTANLSGGQKQLVNLAAALVTKPRILLLDEPTAQLDPLAATQFIQLLGRIHRELGITICIVEHRLEELMPLVDNVLFLEDKTLMLQLPPRELLTKLQHHPLLRAFGAAPYIFQKANLLGQPLTVHEAKRQLKIPALPLMKQQEKQTFTPLLQIKDLHFRYDKKAPDLLTNVQLAIPPHSVTAIVGGNGSGKSTLLQVISGILKPYKGKIIEQSAVKHPFAMLPQNPQSIFTKNTVEEELQAMKKIAGADFEQRKQFIVELFQLAPYKASHPLDLSGGQQQLLAFSKLYCLQCPILLLDEPTKGLDVQTKALIEQAIDSLHGEQKTILIVTHDLDFAAQVATHCTMLFQGQLTPLQNVRQFFCTNQYYTTATRRMTAHISNAITCDEFIEQLHAQGANYHA